MDDGTWYKAWFDLFVAVWMIDWTVVWRMRVISGRQKEVLWTSYSKERGHPFCFFVLHQHLIVNSLSFKQQSFLFVFVGKKLRDELCCDWTRYSVVILSLSREFLLCSAGVQETKELLMKADFLTRRALWNATVVCSDNSQQLHYCWHVCCSSFSQSLFFFFFFFFN